ncbi:MAG: glycine cleavage system protein T [Candidatus Contendobacter odensis]|uniref:Glycine cleavage system protein T n=1 Tax=Candidatus Contendibacter odensensis TaxID=1400860 RepID=A0A2G6PEQ5_9GAMM|nr:MAG: glycine cleavage system protein T [Candidatus Contendobacter odensis]
MNTEWAAFLESAGAIRVDGQTQHFGNPNQELQAALTHTICCDLSHHGLIAAQGIDACAFLQGQLTCDVRHITPDLSLIGAYCTPKGRMLASCRLFRCADSYYLSLPLEMVNPTLTRLRKYVLRARVTLDDASDTLTTIGIAGNQATSLLKKILGAVPEQTNGVISTSQNITVICLPGSAPRYILYGEVYQIKVIWEALTSGTVPTGPEAWRLLDILSGTPAIYPGTTELFIPQMTNLQLLGGISFQKGCYTGQEIVARTHYLGKLKRRMYLARVDTPTPPRPGDLVYSPRADANQNAGHLVDACHHPDGGYQVLAVALIECAENGVLQLGDAVHSALRLEPLPYHFEDKATA